MFYSPFPHGSQREATVRLLPHSANTVTTRQAWADLIMLNRGFLPTSDQHWIAALPPHPKPPDLPSALDGKSHHHHHHHHQRCLSGVKCEMMAERWAPCLKEREVERGGRCRGGGGWKSIIYTHTHRLPAWLSNRNCKSFPLYLHHLLFSELHLFYPQKKKQNQTKETASAYNWMNHQTKNENTYTPRWS